MAAGSNQFYNIKLNVHFELNPLIEEHLAKIAELESMTKTKEELYEKERLEAVSPRISVTFYRFSAILEEI